MCGALQEAIWICKIQRSQVLQRSPRYTQNNNGRTRLQGDIGLGQLGLHLSRSQRLKDLPQKVFFCLRPLGYFRNTESREESSPVMIENNFFSTRLVKMEAEKHLISFKGNKVV